VQPASHGTTTTTATPTTRPMHARAASQVT
jgi:hypothetical protein